VDHPHRLSSIGLVWADSGYAGKLVDYATTMLGIIVQIVVQQRDAPRRANRMTRHNRPLWTLPCRVFLI
jgi:hypothetical protein